jgi:rhodanese-related sulfurtransferase
VFINKEWHKIKIRKIQPKKLAGLLEKNDFYILDVRPLDFELNSSFIEGSFLCPLVFIADRYKEIPKDRQIILTDWAMKQSPIAAKYLSLKGYPIYGVLKGGIERWEAEKLPIEKREPTNELLPLSLPEHKR